jgi:hypothetical protein
MSLFNDAQDLATQAADFRREIHGVNQSGTEQKFTTPGMADPLACYYTPIRDQAAARRRENGRDFTMASCESRKRSRPPRRRLSCRAWGKSSRYSMRAWAAAISR